MSRQAAKGGGRATRVSLLKPLLRAYAFGLVSSIVPKLYRILWEIRKSHVSLESKLENIFAILLSSLQSNRFPAACALIVGGATFLPTVLLGFLRTLFHGFRPRSDLLHNLQFIQGLCFTCSFLSAGLAFQLLNEDLEWVQRRLRSWKVDEADTSAGCPPNRHHTRPHTQYAGKTIDFTLIATVRALDVLCVTAWTRSHSQKRHLVHQYRQLSNFLRDYADAIIFAGSSAMIMWSWFYSPDRLPHDYNRWISRAANIDPRLTRALRLLRQGDFVYGRETGQAYLLKPMCQEHNLPEEYADPCKTIPIPCELYHSGYGPSCEVHTLVRFYRSFLFAMKMYLPLQLLMHVRYLNHQVLWEVLKASAQSSSFLAAFVSLFYYGVCLARTRIGPKLFSSRTVPAQMWDSGLCIMAGCLASGWSILLENPSRRQEVAFFVAPRALATLFPRLYEKRHRTKEQLVFATSIAVVMSAIARGDEKNVRGVLGRILTKVMK